MALRFRAHVGPHHVAWLTSNVLSVALMGVGLATHTASATQGDPPRPVYASISKTERLDAGVIRVVYDLAGSGTRFTVALEASRDGGQTFALRPTATKGDVGPNVSPGPGKTIEWDSTKDIDDLQLDRIVFRVSVTASAALKQPAVAASSGNATAGKAAAAATGTLTVSSTPSEVPVAVDGEPRGKTPLTVTGLAVGIHRVTLTMPGFVDFGEIVEIAAGRRKDLKVSLVSAPSEPLVIEAPFAALNRSLWGKGEWFSAPTYRDLGIQAVDKVVIQRRRNDKANTWEPGLELSAVPRGATVVVKARLTLFNPRGNHDKRVTTLLEVMQGDASVQKATLKIGVESREEASGEATLTLPAGLFDSRPPLSLRLTMQAVDF